MTGSTDDFFRSRLDNMSDLLHPLVVLANRRSWQEIEASLAHRFARQANAGKKLEDLENMGLFGATVFLGDEDVCQRWGETPTRQYFPGLAYFEHRGPWDPTLLVKFRKLIGEEGVEELLARTIEVAVTLKLIAMSELSQIVADSTVQEKSITHPTDSKLLGTARAKLVETAKAQGIELKQTYAKEGQLLGYKAGLYAHARQYKRMRKVILRQRTTVGRLQREVGRKMSALGLAVQEALGHTLGQAQRLISQTASGKNSGKQGKLYSWHAPKVECISKGKSCTPYEFGVKVGIATTLQGNLIVGARTFPGNPYDSHTLNEQVEQASILMQATAA